MRYSLQFKALPKKGKTDDPSEFPPKDEPVAGEMPDAAAEQGEDPAEEATETPDQEAAEPVEGDPAEEAQETPEEEAAEPADEPTDEQAPEEADPNAPQPFAGDVYTQGDETDPAEAFAHLKGEDGTEAWLDHAPDGTIVGWVRTPDGTVYRYSDAAAWAIDVDDAGMRKVGGTMEGGAPAEGEEAPADETPAEDSGESVDGEEPGLDNRNKRFSFEGKSYEITYS